MLNLYSNLSFENIDGGVWSQGFEIKYDNQAIQKEKRLEVIVVPHTHCDPGWGWTFEEYYSMRAERILDGIVEHLPKKKDMSFTYAGC
jgi:alpha-mannosidase II